MSSWKNLMHGPIGMEPGILSPHLGGEITFVEAAKRLEIIDESFQITDDCLGEIDHIIMVAVILEIISQFPEIDTIIDTFDSTHQSPDEFIRSTPKEIISEARKLLDAMLD